MTFIWHDLLFKPLLNLLIGLYNTIGLQNLGLAVIWLTVIVRIFLIPLYFRDKRAKQKEEQLREELKALQTSYQNNPAALREEQRKLLRQFSFRRWPKVISLGVQGVILLLLYQVFLGGINVEEVVDQLYSWVEIPVTINTILLGIDIAQRNFLLSFLCGLVLFANIWLGHRKSQRPWQKADLLYAFGFPAATFAALWYLPSVKAIFILVSMLFSNAINAIRAFRSSIKEQNKQMKDRSTEADKTKKESLPGIKERF